MAANGVGPFVAVHLLTRHPAPSTTSRGVKLKAAIPLPIGHRLRKRRPTSRLP
jgi:hypothetical protein